MSTQIGSESQQLLDELRKMFVEAREIKGQTWIQQSEFKTLCGQFRTSLKSLCGKDGSLSTEEPLRSATMAVIRSFDALEREIEDGFPILGRVIVPQSTCIELVDQVALYLRNAEQFAFQQ